jgi:homoserine dehydrogenase
MAVAEPLNIAIAGFGTVGQAVARILVAEHAERLRLTHVCNRRIAEKRVDWLPATVAWTERFEDVLASDVDVVVELIGGLDPAETWVRRALDARKSVVTANKQLIARHFAPLVRLARERGVQIGFEASVAGGIPVVQALRQGLAGDHLFRVSGILNGTCNYILTRMEADALPFEDALAEAQAKGFAEADPTDDVDGLDARAKLAILARVAFGYGVDPAAIVARSIRPIQAIDLLYARKLHRVIRQVSRLERANEEDHAEVLAFVQPALVPIGSSLANVQGSQNIVAATGRFGGETTFAGFGAGGNPTAVAVVSDLLAIAGGSVPIADDAEGEDVLAITGDAVARHYVRFTVKDRPGIIASLATAFCRHGINIDAVLQEPGLPKTRLPFVITLEECSASVLRRALGEIAALEFHLEAPLALPILD